jgi:hypothetical protein
MVREGARLRGSVPAVRPALCEVVMTKEQVYIEQLRKLLLECDARLAALGDMPSSPTRHGIQIALIGRIPDEPTADQAAYCSRCGLRLLVDPAKHLCADQQRAKFSENRRGES